MPPARPHLSAGQARALLMDAQCLLATPDRRATAASLARLVQRLGYVQLDSINVVDRGHHLTLAARLAGFQPRHLEHLLERRRDLFEHWTHDASAIPAEWFARSELPRTVHGSWEKKAVGDVLSHGQVEEHEGRQI